MKKSEPTGKFRDRGKDAYFYGPPRTTVRKTKETNLTEFLSGNDIALRVRTSIHASDAVDLGVAFWGKGAIDLLGFGKNLENVRVICDLYSGACNPDVLIKMLSRNAKIWTKDGFHAKVYLTQDEAVIGSANASANGLCEEDNELEGAQEAAVSVRDGQTLLRVRQWFDAQLVTAHRVGIKEVKTYRANWRARRQERPQRQFSPTLLGTLDKNSELLRDRPIRFLAYENGGVSTSAKKVYNKTSLFTTAQKKWYERIGMYPFYESLTHNS
jgi:hypothetical protein